MEPRRALLESSILQGLATLHMKVYGLWYFLNLTRTTGRVSWLFIIVCASILIIASIYIIFQIMYIFTIHLDLQKLAFVYLIVAPCMQDLYRVVFFLVKIQDICFIYDTLLEDFLKSIPQHKMSVAKDIYNRTAKKCNQVCWFAYSALVIAGSIWLVVPGYDTDDPTSGRKKVLNGWYPFRYSESPRYELVFSFECVMTLWCGGWYSVFECAILMPLLCLCGHFDVLSYHIATLKKSDMIQVLGRSSANRLEGNAFLNEQLKYILKDYEKLIRYGDTIRETYNLIITIILGAEIMNLTVIVLHLIFVSIVRGVDFQNGEDKDAMFIVKTGTFISFQLIEVVLICYSSEMMERSSSGIREALYFNEWYTADRKLASSQQLMMVRASIPLTLTAVKMYPVNLETLLSIFQFIYSTAALLSKMK